MKIKKFLENAWSIIWRVALIVGGFSLADLGINRVPLTIPILAVVAALTGLTCFIIAMWSQVSLVSFISTFFVNEKKAKFIIWGSLSLLISICALGAPAGILLALLGIYFFSKASKFREDEST